jgi:putative intracellular protease/amidase
MRSIARLARLARRIPATRPSGLLLLPALLLLTACSTPRAPSAADGTEAPNVLLVLTNQGTLGEGGEPTGLFLSEAAHPWHVFREAGFAVTLASPDGGAAPIDPRSMGGDDSENAAFLAAFARGGRVTDTAELGTLDPADFDAIFFVGGHGTMWDFPDDAAVRTTAETIHAGGGVVAAVCHGPAALVSLRDAEGRPLVAGRRVTGFTNAEEDAVELTEAMPFLLETRLRDLGAIFTGAENFQANVVVDGRLVTGQNPASARGTAEATVELVRARRGA